MLIRRLGPAWGYPRSALGDFDRMRRDMLRLLDTFAGDADFATSGVFPPINVGEDRDNYYVRAELPGVSAQNLDISAVNRTLTITGKRVAPTDEGVSYHRRERPEGEFSRTITLPGDFDVERVQASHNNGLLTVTLAKPEQAKPRQIAVKTA